MWRGRAGERTSPPPRTHTHASFPAHNTHTHAYFSQAGWALCGVLQPTSTPCPTCEEAQALSLQPQHQQQEQQQQQQLRRRQTTGGATWGWAQAAAAGAVACTLWRHCARQRGTMSRGGSGGATRFGTATRRSLVGGRRGRGRRGTRRGGDGGATPPPPPTAAGGAFHRLARTARNTHTSTTHCMTPSSRRSPVAGRPPTGTPISSSSSRARLPLDSQRHPRRRPPARRRPLERVGGSTRLPPHGCFQKGNSEGEGVWAHSLGGGTSRAVDAEGGQAGGGASEEGPAGLGVGGGCGGVMGGVWAPPLPARMPPTPPNHPPTALARALSHVPRCMQVSHPRAIGGHSQEAFHVIRCLCQREGGLG